MGGTASRFHDPSTKTVFLEKPLTAPAGCWWHQQGPIAGMKQDCNCHKTGPRRCNPGPPPFPESMAEWMGLPPPPRRQLRPEEMRRQRHPAAIPNPWPMIEDDGKLQTRDLSSGMCQRGDDQSVLNVTEVVVRPTLSVREEPNGQGTVANWGIVPFNGLAPPLEALMSDEVGEPSLLRTRVYNQALQDIDFGAKELQYVIWQSNKNMPPKHQLTIYRRGPDNYTYVADWDPRIVLNTLTAGILRQINRPQEGNPLGTTLRLMPARHTYALQYCARRTTEMVSESFNHWLFEHDTRWGRRQAKDIAPWLAYLMEMYQLWKDISGLDIARAKSQKQHPKRDESTNQLVSPSRDLVDLRMDESLEGEETNLERSQNSKRGHSSRSFVHPWYKTPYTNTAAPHEGNKDELADLTWQTPFPAVPQSDAVSWGSICEDVWDAHKRWGQIRETTKRFPINLRDVLHAFEKMDPILRYLGHGARLDRMTRIVTWKYKWTKYDKSLRKEGDKMCKWIGDGELCDEIRYAMTMLIVAIRQQTASVWQDGKAG